MEEKTNLLHKCVCFQMPNTCTILHAWSFNILVRKLLLSQRLCQFRGSRFSQCFILPATLHCWCQVSFVYAFNNFNSVQQLLMREKQPSVFDSQSLSRRIVTTSQHPWEYMYPCDCAVILAFDFPTLGLKRHAIKTTVYTYYLIGPFSWQAFCFSPEDDQSILIETSS